MSVCVCECVCVSECVCVNLGSRGVVENGEDQAREVDLASDLTVCVCMYVCVCV